MNDIKYPDVEVPLSGEDGNAFFIISRVRGKLRSAGVPEEELDEFTNDAMSGDNNHMIQTCMRWVTVL